MDATARAPNERTTARRIAATVLGLALLTAAGAYVAAHWSEVVRGLEIRPVWLMAAVGAELLLIGVRSIVLRDACRRFEVEMESAEAVGLVCWATLANYVATSLGGTGLRAAYLKKRHALDLAGFVSLTSGLYALQFLLVASAGAIATWLVALPAATALGLRLAFAAIAALAILLLLVPVPVPTRGGVIARNIRRLVDGRRRLAGPGLTRFVAWLSLYVAASALALFSYFAFVGWRFSLAEALLIATLSELSLLVAVTPAGLGVLESAVGLGAGLVGAPPALGLTVAGVRRLVGTLLAALLAVVLAPWRQGGAGR